MDLPMSNIIEMGVGDNGDEEDIFSYDFLEEMNWLPVEDHQSGPVRKQRRLKAKRNQPSVIPRVVKHDVRRYYSRMLANIWNSHDPHLFQSFLHTYSVPHVRSRHVGSFPPPPVKLLSRLYSPASCRTHIVTVTPSSSPVTVPISDWSTQGINIFAKWMGYVQQLVPDQTMTISSTKIHSNSQWKGSSIVTFRLINNLTRMFDFEQTERTRLMEDMVFYDCDLVDQVIVDKELIHPNNNANNIDNTNEATTMRIFETIVPASASFKMPNLSQQYCHTFGRPPKVLSSEEMLTVMIDVSMHINEQRQIESITFSRI